MGEKAVEAEFPQVGERDDQAGVQRTVEVG